MFSLVKFVRNFLKKDEGTSSVEYAVMVALIVAVCVSVVGGLGLKVAYVCDTVCEYVKTPK